MFIAIEGIDGSGKSTMVKQLYKYCTQTLKVKTISLKFPVYKSPYGHIIARYLNGDFDPNLSYWPISILYDCDKFNYKPILMDHIANHDVVILDRYILSNIAYSCANMKGIEFEDTVINNLWYLNNIIFEMPLPNITFLLDIDDVDYLKIKKIRDIYGGNDIHENNLQLLRDTREVYDKLNELEFTGRTVKIPYSSIEDRLQLMINTLGTL